MKTTLSDVCRVLLSGGLAVAPASAEVVRIEVESRSDVLGGQSFGPVGAYEKLAGKIFFAVDPMLPANRIVIEERYRDKDQYIGLVGKAGLELIDQGFLLAEDLPAVLKNAARHFDCITSAPPPSTVQR